MKKLSFLLVLSLFVSMSLNSQTVQVSEVMYNPINANDQWLEIHNYGNNSVNLAGHYIMTTGSAVATHAFFNQLTIPANSYAIIFNPSNSRELEFQDLNSHNNITISYTWSSNLPTTDFNCFVSTGTRYKDRIVDSRANVKTTSGGNGNGFSVEIEEIEYPLSGNANKYTQSLHIGGTPGGAYRTYTYWGSDGNLTGTPNNSQASLEIVSGVKSFSNVDLEVNNVIIRSGATLSLQNASSRHLTINGSISNNGNFNVQNDYSIVQVGTGVNTGSGVSSYSRAISTSPGAYQIWSSPVDGGSLTGAFGLDTEINYCDIYTFYLPINNYLYDWVLDSTHTCINFQTNQTNNVTFDSNYSLPGADGIFNVGYGYFAPGRDDVGSYEFDFSSNSFNTGDISYPIVGSSNGHWALIGNPYPGGISASSFLSQNSGAIYPAIYFWENGANWSGNGTYRVWTNLGSIGSPYNGGVISHNLASQSVPSTQGFFVEVNNPNSGPIQFNNSMRTTGMNAFYKNNNSQNDLPKVWLSLNSKEVKDNLLIGFADDADLNRDNYDARKLYPPTPIISLNNKEQLFFYSLDQNKENKFVIQALPTYDINNGLVIPLGLQTSAAGKYVVNIDSIYGVEAEDVVLIDNYNNVEVSLTNPYSFEVDGAGEINDRFSLRFTEQFVDNSNSENSVETNIKVYQRNDELVVESNHNNIKRLILTDISGRVVFDRTISNLNYYQTNKSNFKGIYIATVYTENKDLINEKVIIH